MFGLRILKSAALVLFMGIAFSCFNCAKAADISIEPQENASLKERVKKSFDENWEVIKKEQWNEMITREGEKEADVMLFKMTLDKVSEELSVDRGTVRNFVEEDDYVKKERKGIFKRKDESLIKSSFRKTWGELKKANKNESEEMLFKMTVQKVSRELDVLKDRIFEVIEEKDYIKDAE